MKKEETKLNNLIMPEKVLGSVSYTDPYTTPHTTSKITREEAGEIYKTLSAVDLSKKTEKKKTGNTELTYLSWSHAWEELAKHYPDATYKVLTFDGGLPYLHDENTGYMVFTEMTIKGLTRTMWLPVMDGANKAMKNKPCTYKTKYGDKSVAQATMFDINKTILRCLVKNIAMFGLGLYIYNGEDLPTPDDSNKEVDNKLQTRIEDLSCEIERAGSTASIDMLWKNSKNLLAELKKNHPALYTETEDHFKSAKKILQDLEKSNFAPNKVEQVLDDDIPF